MFFHSFLAVSLLSLASARTLDVHIDIDEQSLSSGNDVSLAASCYWSGTSPFCAGSCDGGYSDCATSSCGDGACCVTGYKKYCCRGGCPNLQALKQLVGDATILHEEPQKEEPKTVEVSNTQQPSRCYWDGTSPFCAGGCPSGYSDCSTSSCGDGACCVTGYKKYCCRGGCSSSNSPFDSAPQQAEMQHGNHFHKLDGDNDDLCKDDEFICCAPAASRNKECKCIKKKKASSDIFYSRKQKIMDDDAPGGQLCKEKQTLCCNPGATGNEECACIDE